MRLIRSISATCLGDVVLIEVRRAPRGSLHPLGYRYRLIGADVVERDGYDLTNMN